MFRKLSVMQDVGKGRGSERRRLGSGHGRPGLPASLICWDSALQVGVGLRLAFSIDHTANVC